MQEYVLGFAFSTSGLSVALVMKDRPEWMKGKFNGIGGKIDPGEEPSDAMEREFFEETGVRVPARFAPGYEGPLWIKRGEFEGSCGTYRVHVFSCLLPNIHDCRTQPGETERISVLGVGHLPTYPCMRNLTWLIPICLRPEVMGFMVVEYGEQ